MLSPLWTLALPLQFLRTQWVPLGSHIHGAVVQESWMWTDCYWCLIAFSFTHVFTHKDVLVRAGSEEWLWFSPKPQGLELSPRVWQCLAEMLSFLWISDWWRPWMGMVSQPVSVGQDLAFLGTGCFSMCWVMGIPSLLLYCRREWLSSFYPTEVQHGMSEHLEGWDSVLFTLSFSAASTMPSM